MDAVDIAGWTVIGGIVILAIVIATVEGRRARKEAQEAGRSSTRSTGPTDEEIRAFREREDRLIRETQNWSG